jgi:uncharacterized circularly permuted ATP-grasp superfamily protein
MSMAELRTSSDLWDELLHTDGAPRDAAAELVQQLQTLGLAELQQRQDLAELDIVGMGITFTVYSEQVAARSTAPGRSTSSPVIAREEWQRIERGLRQRLRALNASSTTSTTNSAS